jgi:hypothetical protein
VLIIFTPPFLSLRFSFLLLTCFFFFKIEDNLKSVLSPFFVLVFGWRKTHTPLNYRLSLTHGLHFCLSLSFSMWSLGLSWDFSSTSFFVTSKRVPLFTNAWFITWHGASLHKKRFSLHGNDK